MGTLAFIALGDHLGHAGLPLATDWGQDVVPTPERLKGLLQLALGPLNLRQRTQVIITLACNEGAGLTRGHFAITHVEQPMAPQTRLHARDARDVEWIIRPLARHHRGRQGHAKRIKHRLHHFALGQIRAMILAMAKLKHSPFTHARVGTGTRTIDVHPFTAQVVDTNGVLIQGGFKGRPPGVVMERAEHAFEPIISKIEARDRLPRRGV